ncbi:MAG: hypothetical protein A2W99_03800 [Bacteroidetes bacterium GWF2_33_16]|nr:MAG: hypothetical protein A2X00_12210 [Bacteroidetes bacterium GWE2_32_14]OFY02307.1 MAG: hypothetical protein A2W99_03800 [Bacteroidetes bacterium GWF2_33_16]
MKRLLLFITFLVLTNISFSQDDEFQELYSWMKKQIVEKHIIDLDFDNKADTIILKGLVNYDNGKLAIGDPGIYMKFIINFANGKHLELDNHFDYVDSLMTKKIPKLIDSDLFYLIQFNKSHYIFLNEPKYGCCLENFWIVQVNNNELKKQTLQFQVYEIYDINSDNKLDLIGFKSYSDRFESFTQFRLIDYTPFEIYSQVDSFKINPQLSESFNNNLLKRFGSFPDSLRQFIVIKPSGDSLKVDYETAMKKYCREYPEASYRKFGKYDLGWRKPEELRLMRNEIFAAHGYIFSSPDLKEHFESTEWYIPKSKNVNDKLTEIEKYNINLISEQEKK